MTGDGLGRGLSDMWRSVLLFLPRALAFIAILIIGYVLARLLRTVVAKALHRVGFDRAVDKGAVGRALRGSNITPSDLCAKIAFYAVMLFALQLAFGLWAPNAVSDLLNALIAWLPRAFVAIVIIVVAASIAGAAYDLISSALGGLTYGRLLARTASVLIIALGVIAALDQVRIATSVTQPLLIAVLATVAGVVIVGVGGGLIRPMQQRWDTWLDRASAESAAIREHARTYADERARAAAEAEAAAKAAEEARLAEEARKAEEKRLAEERKAAEAREAEERKAAEAREAAERAAERKAEEDRKAEAARRVEEVKLAEQTRLAEEARAADAARQAEAAREAAETDRLEAARLADADATREAERARALEAAAAEETQVIPVQQPKPPRRVTDTAFDLERVDERPHMIPGFDDREGEPDDTAEVPPVAGEETPERTQVLPRPPGGDETQVLPPGDTSSRPGSGPSGPETRKRR